MRASVHGFVDLELRGGLGLRDDIHDSFSTTTNLVIEAIAAHSTRRSLTSLRTMNQQVESVARSWLDTAGLLADKAE